MKQQLFVALTALASGATLIIPDLVRAQTSIEELQQRSNGTTVSGEIVSVVGNDFVLDDGTGQIIVDAGPRWWQEINLSPGEEVTVTAGQTHLNHVTLAQQGLHDLATKLNNG